MDTTKEEDVGEENRTVVCQGAAVIRRGWKRKKRYLTLFNDILVVSSKLSICEAKKHNIMGLPMQIFTEDIACCDTNIEDYQLWFYPGPGKAPRVLQDMKEKTFKKQRTSMTSQLDRGSVPH